MKTGKSTLVYRHCLYRPVLGQPEAHKIILVVIDPLSRFWNVQEEKQQHGSD